jgi:hypothetical protein
MLHLFESSNIRCFHAAILEFSVTVRGIRYPVFPANLFDLAAALDLFQDLHDLRLGETTFPFCCGDLYAIMMRDRIVGSKMITQ